MLRQQPAAVRDKALGIRTQIGFERRDHGCQYALQACSIVHDDVPPGDDAVLVRANARLLSSCARLLELVAIQLDMPLWQKADRDTRASYVQSLWLDAIPLLMG